MSTCYSKTPIECWRFTKQTDAAPMWALPWINAQHNGKLEYTPPDNNAQCEMEDGDWLVRNPSGHVEVFSDAEFSRLFEISPEAQQ